MSDLLALPEVPMAVSGEVPEAEFLAEKAGAIRALAKNVVRDVIEIGRHLSETKDRVGHGKYLQWIEREFEWSHAAGAQGREHRKGGSSVGRV